MDYCITGTGVTIVLGFSPTMGFLFLPLLPLFCILQVLCLLPAFRSLVIRLLTVEADNTLFIILSRGGFGRLETFVFDWSNVTGTWEASSLDRGKF